MVNVADPGRAAQWDTLSQPYEEVFPGPFAPENSEAVAAQNAAVSGAASKIIELFFCYDEFKLRVWCTSARKFIADANKDDAIAPALSNYGVPYLQGQDIAVMVRSACVPCICASCRIA
jgi:hypothetical protein